MSASWKLTHTNRGKRRSVLTAGFIVALLAAFSFLLAARLTQRSINPGRTGAKPGLAISKCPGDINLDTRRDIRDLILLQTQVLGTQALSGEALAAADVNGDAGVDVLDVVRLQQHVNGQRPLEACAVISTPNPQPVLTSISPATATAGDPALILTVTGTNFTDSSVVQWDGVARTTTFVSSTQLRAAIGAADLASSDTVAVSVASPPPGGGDSEGAAFYISPNAPPPRSDPYIRYLFPFKGPSGTPFTLYGKFDPVAANNRVTFTLSGTDTNVSVTGATATTLTATAPAGLQNGKVYSVTATVNGKATNFVGFKADTEAVFLQLYPAANTLLMPPGSGKEVFVIGGGRPPYSLKALSSDDQKKVRLELKGSLVEVTGLDAGRFGADSVSVEVQDSATPPSSARGSVRLQVPTFAPNFDVTPHNLLAGSDPGFTIKVGTSYPEMATERLKIRIDRAAADFSALRTEDVIGLTDAEGDFGIVQVESASDRLAFSMAHNVPQSQADLQAGRKFREVFASGSIRSDSSGITLIDSPDPPPVPESIVGSGASSDIILGGGMIRLPADPDVSFTITATLTSTTVLEGRYLPMTRVIRKSFKTLAPAAGAPRITRLSPVRGEIGRLVDIEGSGFSPTPAENKVTFGDVAAPIKTASSTLLTVVVPHDAVLGSSENAEPVRVTRNNLQSNAHWFRVLFRPDGSVSFLDLKANTATAPILVIGQPSDRVRLTSARFTVDDGRLSTSGLVKDQTAGAGLWGTEPVELIYRGQETSGARRHSFDIEDPGGGFRRTTLFVSENAGGKGITLEIAVTANNNLSGKAALLRFTKPIYIPPAAAGTPVNTTALFESGPWTYYPRPTLSVTYKREVSTE